jgi:heme/copper-type cytochrome/quinol oxidase subunit 2
MSDSVVAIVSAFFIIGITVGVIVVVAISALRADRRGGGPAQPARYGPRMEHRPPEDGGAWHVPGWDAAGPGDQRRWPGDNDNDFTSG